MAETNKIFVQIDNEIIELTGNDKKLFIEEQKILQEKEKLEKLYQETQKALKISAYSKLGLTDEEIQAIL